MLRIVAKNVGGCREPSKIRCELQSARERIEMPANGCKQRAYGGFEVGAIRRRRRSEDLLAGSADYTAPPANSRSFKRRWKLCPQPLRNPMLQSKVDQPILECALAERERSDHSPDL